MSEKNCTCKGRIEVYKKEQNEGQKLRLLVTMVTQYLWTPIVSIILKTCV